MPGTEKQATSEDELGIGDRTNIAYATTSQNDVRQKTQAVIKSDWEKMGFKVEPVHIRETGKPIDNVNMYASFYKATRL